MNFRNFEPVSDKASLTPDERLRAAYGHFILGIHQHDLAAVMGVNSGRVNEAVMAVRVAITDPKGTVERAEATKGEGEPDGDRA